ncbi:hypothetical protein EVAR_82908_1 [Eumeta japonica]|uniref:Uncharacterized protein n=1 Tax=Eumeta variegata TaxID=151549 RepID=A0A4C1X4G8_EUMVA|nr:hypothetical protein EVAR_82908_1 [Eumeta japonica]
MSKAETAPRPNASSRSRGRSRSRDRRRPVAVARWAAHGNNCCRRELSTGRVAAKLAIDRTPTTVILPSPATPFDAGAAAGSARATLTRPKKSRFSRDNDLAGYGPNAGARRRCGSQHTASLGFPPHVVMGERSRHRKSADEDEGAKVPPMAEPRQRNESSRNIELLKYWANQLYVLEGMRLLRPNTY